MDAGKCELAYTSSESVSIVAKSADSWIHDFDVSEYGIIRFSYDSNTTGHERESIIELNYNTGRAYINVIQESANSNAEFSFSIDALSDYNITYSVTPKNLNERYLYGIVSPELYNRFSSDEYFVDYLVGQMKDMAEEEEMSFESLIETLYATGIVQCTYEGMMPDSEYLMFAYRIDGNYKLSSEFCKQYFMSASPVKFSMSADVKGPVVEIHTVPTYENRQYVVMALTQNECKNNMDNAVDALMDLIEYQLEYITWGGHTVAEYIDEISNLGESNVKMILNILTEYYAIAVSISHDLTVTSEAEVIEFETADVNPSDNILSISITDVTATTAHYNVSPTNDDTYLFFIDPAANWETYDDEYLTEYIAGLFGNGSYLRSGESDGTIDNLQPGTKYLAFAFGALAGKPTTKIVKTFFTTKSK